MYKKILYNIGDNILITERVKQLYKQSVERAKRGEVSHFDRDYHYSALTLFDKLPLWEKTARAMAYAITNQDVWAYENDNVGGRIYFNRELPVGQKCHELDFEAIAKKAFNEKFPEGEELIANQLIFPTSFGHITWLFDKILSLGTSGLKKVYEKALEATKDEKSAEFFNGVIIMLDALQAFNDKHIEVYEKLGNHKLAELMRKVPKYPCESFEEAVQAFFMQHIVVIRENPYGGNGPGRLDYFLWPYLERDLKEGRCTLEKAREIIDELFIRLDERLYFDDRWTEAIVVGGTDANGNSAVNPLTYVMIESIMDLKIIHPAVYVRLPKNPPEQLLSLCAEYIASGNNRAQVINDTAIIKTLVDNGVDYEDAVNYTCGGCMEIGVQGKNSDLMYTGWQNTAKMLELMITGGYCLKARKRLSCFKANKGLVGYSDFESFYADFLAEADRITKIFLTEQEFYSKAIEEARPSYLVSSMLDDCLERGRNMHGGGVKYHDYGGTPLALPNVADSLYAIKKAVFEDKICTAEELVQALKSNFKSYEKLQATLKAIPKYGTDNEDADAMAKRVMADLADTYLTYRTRHGGKGKPTLLTFIYSPAAASILGATADGKNAGNGVAHGITPQSSSMTKGITAAINSCVKMPMEKFYGGASTMWDLDSSYADKGVIKWILKTFIDKNGQIFQGNSTPVEELLQAKIHPEKYENLMVRVGGFSARFVNLENELQDEIINRIRHCI